MLLKQSLHPGVGAKAGSQGVVAVSVAQVAAPAPAAPCLNPGSTLECFPRFFQMAKSPYGSNVDLDPGKAFKHIFSFTGTTHMSKCCTESGLQL